MCDVATAKEPAQPLVWQVSALCLAVTDALQARFNPVLVRGELSGFLRAASGHSYFALKDSKAQLRCVMFKRSSEALNFVPRDGELVEVCGSLGVYEPRGDLQLLVQSMRRVGVGNLFEQFLQLKERLQAEGLFDASRKRPLPLLPRAIGLVTSLGAAALHDVAATLHRRVPHIPVVLAPALVQGAAAPAELMAALSCLYALARPAAGQPAGQAVAAPIDVIMLVRGGGAMEDLWAFNDEALARTIASSPVPLICGVGHESDFTIADFVADVRAPTPTAAAELVAPARQAWLDTLELLQQRLQAAGERYLDRQQQRLDQAALRLKPPMQLLATQRQQLEQLARRWRSSIDHRLQWQAQQLQALAAALSRAVARSWQGHNQRLQRAALRLGLLDPQLVLERGYVWLSDAQGQAVTRASQTYTGQALAARLADGMVELTVVKSGHETSYNSVHLQRHHKEVMEHSLIPLPYPLDALEPHCSRETMEYHYGRHHQAYVDNLNKLQQGTEFASMTLEEIVKKSSGAIYNNAAQNSNHNFFWHCMTPNGGGQPGGALAAAIDAKWGNYAAFRDAFIKSAVGNFGAGWTWLVQKGDGSLEIVNMGPAGSPIATGDRAILGLDVWEHAYYIDYRNQRQKYVEAFLDHLVNWPFAQSKLA